MNNSNTVIILSGVSGSGKSTFANKCMANWVWSVETVSADDYFITTDGVYEFNPMHLGEAHAQCMRRFIDALERGTSLVLVDNTNTTELEIAPYYAVAKAFGYTVLLITMECHAEIAAKRNTHDVPLTGITAMGERINRREIPPFWDINILLHNSDD